MIYQITIKHNTMTTQQIKMVLKENGAINVKVRKVKAMGKYQYGIFNWDFNQISKEKFVSLFPQICISALGQAWL